MFVGIVSWRMCVCVCVCLGSFPGVCVSVSMGVCVVSWHVVCWGQGVSG